MSLSDLIVEFYEKMSSWEESVVEGTGISLSKMHLIEIIGIFGSMMMKDLADKVGVTTGTLTIAVDRLESKGLVERVQNRHDRRSYLIALTNEGKKLYEAHNRAHNTMTARCLEDFGPKEKETLEKLLRRFTEKL